MSGNLDRAFAGLDVVDRAYILDKIHNLRVKAATRVGNEDVAKPYLPTMSGPDRDKIMAQYFAAKRQMQPEAKVNLKN